MILTVRIFWMVSAVKRCISHCRAHMSSIASSKLHRMYFGEAGAVSAKIALYECLDGLIVNGVLTKTGRETTESLI